jgi:hypothetical protein
MKQLSLALMPFLLGIVSGSTQSALNSTWWPCEPLSPYQNLQLEQVRLAYSDSYINDRTEEDEIGGVCSTK